MNEAHYGYVINTHYDWINMLNTMKKNKSNRFEEFSYGQETIYHFLERIEQEQHTPD